MSLSFWRRIPIGETLPPSFERFKTCSDENHIYIFPEIIIEGFPYSNSYAIFNLSDVKLTQEKIIIKLLPFHCYYPTHDQNELIFVLTCDKTIFSDCRYKVATINPSKIKRYE